MAGASEESKGVESLKNFERALGHVRNSVRPLTLMSREEVGGCVSAKDHLATLATVVAYGVSSLFYMFLKTQGVSPSTHPVKGELDRIRGYFGRLKNVGKPPEQRTLKVDQDASRRFINAALSGDSVWQNAKGTDPKSAQQKRASAGIGRANPAGQPEDFSAQAAGAAAAAAAEAEAPESTPLPVDGGTGQKPLLAATPGSKRGGRNAKRKLTAGTSAGAAVVAGATRAGAGAGKKSRSGGGGSNASRGDGPAEARWGEGPEAAVPGESTPGPKKPTGKAGKNKKKNSRHNAW
ncbi:unnamed protein product [Ectocarpus sp. 6 AP-2014]